MKLHKSWLLLATCTIVLAVTTCATTPRSDRQIQAEVSLKQVAAASPSRSLKYGEKTTKKVPNKEILFLTTTPRTDKSNSNNNSSNIALPARKPNDSHNRSRSRAETKKEISRRHDIISAEQNQLNVQHETQIVHKNRELLKQPIAASVGQQRTRTRNISRSSNTLKQTQQQPQLQPTQYPNLNVESETTAAKTKASTTAKTLHKSRQRIPTTTSLATPSANIYRTPLSTNNSNVHAHHAKASSNSTVVVSRRYQSNERKRNNNNINSNSQPLLASSNTFTAAAAGRGSQSKTESSSNKKTALRPPFQLPDSFNIFASEFWQFLNPTSRPVPRLQTIDAPAITSTRKPPKKYKPPTQVSTKEEKLSLVKPKPTFPPRTTTKQPIFDSNNNNNNSPKKDEGPFRIALPTSNILSSKRETNDEGEKDKRNVENESAKLRERFECPRESEVRFQLFPKICKIDEDCKVWNREEICCEIFGAKSCVSGMPKPLEETSHTPILGLIPRKCPSRPLAELWWEVKECETDIDCWPRVCCPDGRKRYCRTSQPELNTVPVSVQRSFNYLTEYLECTPPPPPIFDLHPKPCSSTWDCFPNVCCQEAGLRHCRPPKKSVLTMLANIFNVDFVKRLTQNIVIK